MASADFRVKNGLTVDNNVTVAGTSLNLGTSTAALTTTTIGGAITGNILKIASTTSGTINLTTDVTTGTVNEWTGITTGTVNLATGGASTTNIGGAGSTLVIGKTSGNSILTVNGNTAATVNIANTSGVYQINGTTVLNSSTLGSGVTSSSLTTVGTIGTGVWNGTIITGAYGGTGVANTGKTITLGGNLTTSGAFATTITASNTTSVTLPTSGTLVGSNDTGTVTNTMLAGSIANNKLTNSSITVGTTSISLGSSSTTLSGVTSIDGGTSISQTLTIQSTTGIGSSDSIIFKVGNNSTAVTINTSGNVGIGETAPTGGKLVVKGSGGSAYITSAGTGLSFTNDGTNYISTTTSNGQLQFQTGSSTNAVLINSSGNIVIGTGEGGATPVGNTIRAPSGTGTNIAGGHLTITAGNGTGTGGSGSIYFQTAPTSTTGTTANTLATVVTIDNTGSVTIAGNLTVNGTTTTVNSTTITVNDKNIELGKVLTPTNTTADGGGITLKGATDKTWNWVNSTSSWTSSENIDMASGKAYYINGTSVLNSSTLGSGVTGSSLTSVGTLTNLTVTNTISGSINGNAATVTNGFYTTSSFYLGTTSIAVNRASATQSLSGITSIDGGTSVSQALTIQSTTGNGSSDSIVFKVGNNGATTAMTILTGGAIQATTGVRVTSLSDYGQFSAVSGSSTTWYNAMLRNDGSNVYLLSSDAQTSQANAINALWNSYRPFSWNLSSGTVTLAGDGSNTQTGGNLVVGAGDGGATPVGNALRAPAGSGTNITGGSLTVTAGNGTGTGGSGNIYFQTAPVGSTGASANTMATVMTMLPNGNVGIGTTSPGSKLDVSSSSNVIVASRSTGGYAAFQRLAPTGQAAYDFYTINGVEAGRITVDGSNIMAFATGSSASERMRIDSSGNVGIGTASPASVSNYTLLTLNNAVSGGGIYLQSNGTTVGSLTTNSGATTLATATAVPLVFYTNNAEKMRIDASGNVGIGTTSPGSKLELSQSSAAATGPILFLHNTAAVQSGGTGNSTRITFGCDTGASASSGNAYIIAQEDGASSYGTSLQFGTVPAGGSVTEQVRIDSSGNLLIGTTSAYGKLFVSQTNNNTCALFSLESGAGAGNVATRVNTNLTTQKNMTLEYLGVAKGTFKTDSGAVYFDGTQGTTIFQTAGTERMRIDSSGNVGIGTTTPAAPLQIGSSTNQSDGKLMLASGNGVNSRTWSIRTPYGGANVADPNYGFVIRDETGAVDRLSISYSTGNIGIGTASPSRKVDIEQASTDYQLRIGDTFGNYYDIGRNSSDGLLHFYGSQTVASGYVFDTVNGERARINSVGNMGLGISPTTDTTYRWLQISGNSSTVGGVVQTQTSGGEVTSQLFNNNLAGYVGTGTNHPFIFRTNATERMRIDTSGNVLPGATGTQNLGSSSLKWATMYGVASSANYADLAERYTADDNYEPGTVLEFGGVNEVTISNTDMSRRIAGVVSTNPGYLMNAELESEFVVSLALTGRVPCKVQGAIRKGDMMVSASNGYARAEENPKLGSVIGKALEDFNGITGVIEIVVGRL
jgi:hypothetical protein